MVKKIACRNWNGDFDSFVYTLELHVYIIGVVPKRNASDVVRKAELQYSYSTYSSINALVLWLMAIMAFLLWLLPPIFYNYCKKLKTNRSVRICHSRQSHQNSNSLEFIRYIIFIIIMLIFISYFSISLFFYLLVY